MTRCWMLFGAMALCGTLCAPRLGAQVTAIDDTFDEDPFASGDWIRNGTTSWVGPDDAGSLYPGEGYVLVTPAATGQGGNMFRSERIEYDNFRLLAEVELQGSCGTNAPADGMSITIVGSDAPPALGQGGGAMGATGLGTYPTMIFEFDNWNNGTPDRNNNNHVGFEYSPDGFAATDQLPSDAFYIVPIPLNGSGRFLFEVFVQGGTVACNLSNEDAGLLKTRTYTYSIPDFAAFEGYIGVTGSTGDACQNHILHSIQIDQLPDEFCLKPPLDAIRSFPSATVENRQATPADPDGTPTPVFEEGADLTVQIALTNIRADDPPRCLKPSGVRIVDTIPAGWTFRSATDGGTFDAGTNTVSFTVPGAAIVEGKTVSYVVTTDDATIVGTFAGTVVDTAPFSEPVPVAGVSSILKNTPYDACGGIRKWNILGAYTRTFAPSGDNPGEAAMREDYLTDGGDTELDVVWYPGRRILTDFNGASVSTGILSGSNNVNPGGVPTMLGWIDDDGFIDLNIAVYGNGPDQCMAYAQCYVINNTGGAIDAYFGLSSDDSIALMFNGEYHYVHSIPRGGASACTPQDNTAFLPDGITPNAPVTIEEGENVLVVKTFEGAGDFNFSCRFQDEFGSPLDTTGIDIVLEPTETCVKPPFAATRSLDTGDTVVVEGSSYPLFEQGAPYTFEIAISDVRPAAAPCGAPTNVTIRETVPAGWAAANPSNGGTVVGSTITWTLAPPFPAQLTYEATAVGSVALASFSGTVTEAAVPGYFDVGGQQTAASVPPAFTSEGFITTWLLLGPYVMPTGLTWGDGSAPSVANMRRDLLTDGAGITELTVVPEVGDTVATAFRGASPATGLGSLPTTPASVNPGGVPTWSGWQDLDDTINFGTYYGGNIDRVVMYAVAYVELDFDTDVSVCVGSDDSIQVLIDDAEVLINSLGRGWGAANECQNTVNIGTLEAGVHKVMVKVFDGTFDHGFRLRLQDPATGQPVSDGICVTLDPEGCGGGPPPGNEFIRADSNSDGAVNITDGIFVLNFLFLGGDDPPCSDAADANNDAAINITDGIYILNFLFLGGGDPPVPHPDCGLDPEGDGDGVLCEAANPSC